MRTVTVTDSERPMVFKFFLDDEEVPRFLGVEFWPRDDEPAQHIPEKERTRLLRNAMFVLSTLGQWAFQEWLAEIVFEQPVCDLYDLKGFIRGDGDDPREWPADDLTKLVRGFRVGIFAPEKDWGRGDRL